MKKKLLAFAKNLSPDFKEHDVKFDLFITITMDSKGFDKLYNSIVKLKDSHKEAFGKLYTYFYYHYC